MKYTAGDAFPAARAIFQSKIAPNYRLNNLKGLKNEKTIFSAFASELAGIGASG